jgi:predicted small secreted protein
MPEWSRSHAAALISVEERRNNMLRKVMTALLIGGALAAAACNTVRGAAKDVNSVANKADNAI